MVASRPSFNGVNTAQVRTTRDLFFPPSTMQIAPWLKNIFLMPKPRRGGEKSGAVPSSPLPRVFSMRGRRSFAARRPGRPLGTCWQRRAR